jgi:hypothetical protein
MPEPDSGLNSSLLNSSLLTLPLLPVRNAIGTNPIASQNRLASKFCAHQHQYSRHPYAERSNCACNNAAATSDRRASGTTHNCVTYPTSSRLKYRSAAMR